MQQTIQKSLHASAPLLVTGVCLWGLSAAPGLAQPKTDVELRVGVVQRFGENPTDRLILEAGTGDRINLRFVGNDNKPQTLQANKVTLEVTQQPLPEPQVEERLVLGNYRSFETAENSAEQWKQKGIEVEVAQPNRWQVWAKRDVYQTPLVRRLLLQNLKTRGENSVYLDSRTVPQQPRLSLVVNGTRYNPEQLEIRSSRNPVKISLGETDRNPRFYPGLLQVQSNAYGSYTLVNHVPIETYLRGVVPHEISPGAPLAAMEAQAIIARTYALRNLRRFAIDNYQLCADQQCQVYKGLTGTNNLADRAIAASKGKVLTYDNELVDALYSSTTGGVTAAFNDVWNGAGRPYLQPVVDSKNSIWDLTRQPLSSEENFRRFINLRNGFNENGWQSFRWRRESTIAQITEDLRRYIQNTRNPFGDFQSIQEIRVEERSPAGRIQRLSVNTNKGVLQLYKDDIRSAFMAPRSTLFYLEPIKEANNSLKGYAFVGGGFGHGVGLSQTGAFNLAKQGWTGTQILNFYYPGTQLQTLNDSIVLWQDERLQSISQR